MAKQLELKDRQTPPDTEVRRKGETQVTSIQLELRRLTEKDDLLIQTGERLYQKIEDLTVTTADVIDISTGLKQALHEHKIALSIIGGKMDKMTDVLERLIVSLDANTATGRTE